MNIKTIRDSFELLSSQIDSISLNFYRRLFVRYPSVRPLFEGTDSSQQAKKLTAALVLLVNSLDNPDKLSRALLELGRKHQEFGAEPAHYEAVKEVLLEVLAEAAGDHWTDELQQAWSELLGTVAGKMIEGYSKTESTVDLVGTQTMKHSNENELPIQLQIGGTAAASAVALCALMDATLGGQSWGVAGMVVLPVAAAGAIFCGMKLVKNLSALLKAESVASRAISSLRQGDYTAVIPVQMAGENSLYSELEGLRVSMKESEAASVENAIDDSTAAKHKEMATKYELMDKIHAIIEFDPAGNILVANKNFCTTMGYELEEIVGRHHSMFVEPAYRDSPEYKLFWQKLNSGEIDTNEFKRIGKAGQEVWISASYIPVLDEDGKVSKVVKFASDISDKKLASKLKEALNVSDTNIMVTDENQNIIYANESLFAMLSNRAEVLKLQYPNFNLAELVGTSIKDFPIIPSDDVNQIITHHDVHKVRIPVSDLTFDLVATPILEEDKIFAGTVYEWNDLTDSLAKAETEQAQAAENQGIRSALDVATSNVMLADAENRIIYMNNAVSEMFKEKETEIRQDLPKFSVESLIGETMDVFHKDASHQRRVVGDLVGTRSAVAEVGGISFRIITTAIESEGSRIGTVVEWEDITQELIAEQEAKANARLKQALDSATSNIMLADADNKIIYMNATVIGMFKKAEGKIQQSIPGFSANDLVGKNMDSFHKDPSHQMGLIKGLTSTYTGEAKVSGLTFQVVANPLLSEKGERIGTFVEWKDRTEEIAVEEEVQSVLQGMANGDLTKLVEGDYEGFFGNLKTYINATVEKLIDVVQQIKEASDSVATGSEEICQGNANLSQRTEQQASSLEETSSSMEEMTSTVQQNAENAREADNLAQGAKDKAEHGGAVVGRAVTAMDEINGASKRIADIISVIDEIAFQTNLLALNASVEAARAGEQGRGFAVVASEVRNLAGRSATAAKEIKELIEDSVGKVEQGSKLVDESGKTLEEIITAVQKVTSIVGEISGASVEQAAGIEEVNKAISLMDEMTQQNAALVEQAAAASEAMGDQAGELKTQMGFFNLNSASMNTPPPSGRKDNTTVVEMRRSAQPKPAPSNESIPAPAAMKAASSASSGEWEEF